MKIYVVPWDRARSGAWMLQETRWYPILDSLSIAMSKYADLPKERYDYGRPTVYEWLTGEMPRKMTDKELREICPSW